VEESSRLILETEILQKATLDIGFHRQLQQWVIIGILQQPIEGSYRMNPAFAADIEHTGFMDGLA